MACLLIGRALPVHERCGVRSERESVLILAIRALVSLERTARGSYGEIVVHKLELLEAGSDGRLVLRIKCLARHCINRRALPRAAHAAHHQARLPPRHAIAAAKGASESAAAQLVFL